jgi:hypothetical protein
MKKLFLAIIIWAISMAGACFGQTYLVSTQAAETVVIDSRGIDNVETVAYQGSTLRIETTVTLSGGGIVPTRQQAIISALNKGGRYAWEMYDLETGELKMSLPNTRKDLIIPTSDGGFTESISVKIFVPKGTEVIVTPQV